MADRKEPGAEIAAAEKMAEDIQQAEELYSGGMPYELERIENEIRFFQEQTGAAFLEMGRRFIRIKAREGHGSFLESLARLGMPPRSAQYAMPAHLETSRMKAVTVLDGEDVKTLEAGGSVKGITLDGIDRMSIRELRGNLRKEKEKVKKEKELRERPGNPGTGHSREGREDRRTGAAAALPAAARPGAARNQ